MKRRPNKNTSKNSTDEKICQQDTEEQDKPSTHNVCKKCGKQFSNETYQCWCGILLHYISYVISCIMLLDFEKNNAVLDVFLEIVYIFFVHVSFRKRLSTHSSSGLITKRIAHKT